MNESQRITLAMALCTFIYLAFQWIAPSPPLLEDPIRPPAPTVVTPTGQASPGGLLQQAGVPNPAAHVEGPTGQGGSATEVAPSLPTLSPRARPFATPLLRGALHNGPGAGLSALDLMAFTDRNRTPTGDTKPVSLVPQAAGYVQAWLQWALPSEQVPRLDFVDEARTELAGRTPQGLHVTLRVLPRADAYALDYSLVVKNEGVRAQRVGFGIGLGLVSKAAQEGPKSLLSRLWPGAGDAAESSSAQAPDKMVEEVTALCQGEESGLRRKSFGDVKKAAWSGSDAARWVGLDSQYFALAVLPHGEALGTCGIGAAGPTLTTTYYMPSQQLVSGAQMARQWTVYAGPKREAELSQVDRALPDMIDYNLLRVPLGFLARPMVWVLNLLHRGLGSWGVAIMLLTVSVKLLVFPATYISLMSTRRMQALKPELDAIKVRFAADKERQQIEQVKLFRDRGANPLHGCLPMLLQMPVWITLYRTLWSDVDLYQQPFLWLTDLTAREPIPFLAVAVGALTALQQRLTPMADDNPQAKTIMMVMPFMLVVFMVALPSGLVLYILVNTVLTILQQLAINRRVDPA